ncbi:MAG: gyrase subunit, partial [Labilithrix sp.]|nr:gyrase subunit [Labilithrix sp.]
VKGIILIDASDRNGQVVDVKLVKDGDEIMLITDKGQTIRTSVVEIRETGRNAQGVKIMTVEGDEHIVALERLAETPPDENGGASELPPGMGDGDGDGGDGAGGGGADGGATPASDVPPPEGDLN